MSLGASEKNIVTFAQGTVIAREGEPGGDLLIIRSGVAEVFRTRNGKELILARVGAGEILGVMTVVNGGPRTASVRAKTAVTAVKVEKDRVKDLMDSVPKWAVALINDLVTRVIQTNELYEKSAMVSESTPIGGRNLTLALQVANGFVPLAEKLAVGNEDRTISVDEILDKLSQIVNEPFKDLRRIVDIFDDKELVPWRGKSNNSRCSIGELDHFNFFVKFVKDARNGGRLEELIGAFGVQERKMLRGLAELGLKRLSEKQTQTSVTFRELEDALRFMGHKFDPHVIKQADHYRLLQQTKTGEDLAATFSPRDLRLGILSIECVIAFDQMEDGGQKLARRRSLIY